MQNLNFKKLTLEDKDLFDEYFALSPPSISEYTFSNLYVWHHSRQIEYAQYNGGLIILATHSDKKYFMMPIGFENPAQIYQELLNYGIQHNIATSINRVGEDIIPLLKDKGFTVNEDFDNSDYIYLTDDLAFLKGRKYSNKRGMVRKFFGEYYHKFWSFKEVCKIKCLELTEKWMADKGTNDQSQIDEYNAIKEFLKNCSYFNTEGGVICVDEHVVAYTFGEKLNNNTFVVHFEKGDSTYMGAYQTINKLFAENHILGQYEYINREQDLGIEGIKKAKLSYYPHKMGKKYTISA